VTCFRRVSRFLSVVFITIFLSSSWAFDGEIRVDVSWEDAKDILESGDCEVIENKLTCPKFTIQKAKAKLASKECGVMRMKDGSCGAHVYRYVLSCEEPKEQSLITEKAPKPIKKELGCIK